MLTAKDGEHDEAEGLDLGRRRLRHQAVLVHGARRPPARAAAPGAEPTPATTGSWSATSRSIRCVASARSAAQPSTLTHREFALLEALARRPGEPLTRGELFDRVWGADHPGVSNVVDVYIGYLRRKLDPAGGPAGTSRIETVRGIGYRAVRAVIRRASAMRARLTVLVTAVFAVATTIGAVAVVRIVEDRLVDDTRANAERILSEYLARIYGGTPAVPTVQPEQGTSFFFLDENGREMTAADYREAILDVGFVQALPPGNVIASRPGHVRAAARRQRQLAPRGAQRQRRARAPACSSPATAT